MSATNEELFLAEYEELCEKYGTHVVSCGCCGMYLSPLVGISDESPRDPIKTLASHMVELRE